MSGIKNIYTDKATFRMSQVKSFLTVTGNEAKYPPALGPYSQAVAVGQHIFLSGQIPMDKDGKLVEGSIGDKTAACCESVKAILAEAGSDITKVFKVGQFGSLVSPLLIHFVDHRLYHRHGQLCRDEQRLRKVLFSQASP